MEIDVARAVGAVTREVGRREHEGRPARVVVASRTYDTTVEDLWDALTTPSASRAGSCPSPATCASAAVTSSRGTPAARSPAASRRGSSR